MGITRTAIVDDDGSGTTGTIWNDSWKTELYDQIDAVFAAGGGVVQTTNLTSTQNNLALTAGVGLLRANNASNLAITGFAAGTPGQRLVLRSVGAGAVALAHEDAGSTAANRILTGTGGTLTLLPGSGTLSLIYDGTTARWIATSVPGVGQLRCAAYHSTTQSLTSGAATVLSLDAEVFDTAGFHSTVTNTSRLTIPVGGDGVYLVIGKTNFAASAAGTLRILDLLLNGTAVDRRDIPPPTLGARLQIISTVPAVAGDYLEVSGYQDSGGALLLGSGTLAFATRLTAFKLG